MVLLVLPLEHPGYRPVCRPLRQPSEELLDAWYLRRPLQSVCLRRIPMVGYAHIQGLRPLGLPPTSAMDITIVSSHQ